MSTASSSIALSVNLNKIALIRNSREGNYPNVVAFGQKCLEAGAQGLTVHPRPDGRHIRPHDVYALRKLVSDFPGTEFNIEGNPFAPPKGDYPGLMALVKETHPHQCTLVPDSDSQLTSDHGFDLTVNRQTVEVIVQQLRELGVRSSLFMDPIVEQVELSAAIGADRIELYTGPFAEAFQCNDNNLKVLLDDYIRAAETAKALNIGVNAGHDLNLDNMPLFKQVPYLAEVSIGHAFTVDSLLMGMDAALKAYLEICA
ncbi:pyridoxine 5'-phosphate synthase [Marinagarivorans cellulosilyticus]|uniref:Pyridoxine 5'-phosphate synthase n=1 Tax=Marinagarivorans cellulosilyticus TaxID=2721545 RepID=A0AAN1WJV0_9GAMM|nr:pyridoxine 5'-phosphate synthase [Marinagarivorans cellulosilyticus]BCD98917.1 pyridoxine 5-phosphate synthase [Marinagarivorans cellulosilyticus]